MFDCAVQSLNFNKILFLWSEQIVSMSDFFFLWIYSFSAIPGLRTILGRPSPSYLGATTLCKQISRPVPWIRSIQMKIQICITKVVYLFKLVPYLQSFNKYSRVWPEKNYTPVVGVGKYPHFQSYYITQDFYKSPAGNEKPLNIL